ncbi:hypothetical protein EYF80_017569 [Liparis tanakae]|uniref:Uncharacterized protein n=1 Tax=Liparis tanakae TaxID=230148 RepID=A0A4Z2I2Z5_9TELE|nr:hypothetical protein EYF80_017569 [Liparis tanakae]
MENLESTSNASVITRCAKAWEARGGILPGSAVLIHSRSGLCIPREPRGLPAPSRRRVGSSLQNTTPSSRERRSKRPRASKTIEFQALLVRGSAQAAEWSAVHSQYITRVVVQPCGDGQQVGRVIDSIPKKIFKSDNVEAARDTEVDDPQTTGTAGGERPGPRVEPMD